MAQHVITPKFGDWETNDDVPYTVVFDKARHKKKNVKMTPNNPQQIANTFSDNLSPVQATPFQSETYSRAPNGREAVRMKHVCSSSQEDGYLRTSSDSLQHHDTVNRKVSETNSGTPNRREAVRTKHVRSSSREDGYLTTSSDSLQHHDTVNGKVSETNSGTPNGRQAVRMKHVRSSSREDGDLRTTSDSLQHRDAVNLKVFTDSPLHHHGSINTVGAPKRATRQSVGSERRIEHSALNPNDQAKVGAKVSGIPSPAWERKGSTERGNNLAPLTPGRSRPRSVTQGTETPDHSAPVPKFGEWDESDPTSADGFTYVFNKVREEKINGTGNVSAAAFRKPYYKDQKQHENKTSKKGCCFPISW